MKLLGKGWQYATYDIGGGRVLKKYLSRPAGYFAIFQDFLRYGSPVPWKIPRYYKGCRETAITSLEKVNKHILDPWMMGNPRIINRLDYEQDLLTPLHDVIREADSEKGKELVDKFVAFNKTLIERGLIDKSFNITKNFGLDAKGRVVLMDLGELYSSKEAIDKQRRKRMWASDYVVRYIHNREVVGYYITEMDKAFALRI